MDSESNCSRSSRGDRVTDWLWGDRLETAKILILRAELLGWEGSLKIWCVDRGQSSYPQTPIAPGRFLATAPNFTIPHPIAIPLSTAAAIAIPTIPAAHLTFPLSRWAIAIP